MLDDGIGTKYVTTHRCFGEPCKNEKGEVIELQLEEQNTDPGVFENERDADAGYPKVFPSSKLEPDFHTWPYDDHHDPESV